MEKNILLLLAKSIIFLSEKNLSIVVGTLIERTLDSEDINQKQLEQK